MFLLKSQTFFTIGCQSGYEIKGINEGNKEQDKDRTTEHFDLK